MELVVYFFEKNIGLVFLCFTNSIKLDFIDKFEEFI